MHKEKTLPQGKNDDILIAVLIIVGLAVLLGIFSQWILAHPWIWLIIGLVVTVAIIVGLITISYKMHNRNPRNN
jgi:cyanate permease